MQARAAGAEPVPLPGGRESPDLLAEVLAKASAMPVQTAVEGQPLRRGQLIAHGNGQPGVSEDAQS